MVNDPEGTNVIQVILSGANLHTSRGTGYMPSFAVANYVIGHLLGKAGQMTADLVRRKQVQD
jgi:hypothetical protein